MGKSCPCLILVHDLFSIQIKGFRNVCMSRTCVQWQILDLNLTWNSGSLCSLVGNYPPVRTSWSMSFPPPFGGCGGGVAAQAIRIFYYYYYYYY